MTQRSQTRPLARSLSPPFAVHAFAGKLAFLSPRIPLHGLGKKAGITQSEVKEDEADLHAIISRVADTRAKLGSAKPCSPCHCGAYQLYLAKSNAYPSLGSD